MSHGKRSPGLRFIDAAVKTWIVTAIQMTKLAIPAGVNIKTIAGISTG